jgi:plasmid stabilization system protein ParE
MPRVTIRFAESAIADLEAIRTWYDETGVPDVGDRFVREIIARVEALRDHPEMGRMAPEFDQPFLRELIHPPFRIVYRRDPKHIRIVRVWRSERLLALQDDEEA